ncbi:MAG: hypothetical protein ABIX28_16425 [Vicinamibacterales bacterium]
MRYAALTSAVMVSLCLAPLRAAGGEQSPKAAAELVTHMKSRGLSTIAAADPQTPGRVVAAMLIPDVQLLVIGATSTAAPYLESQIAQGKFDDVYSTLNATAVADTKIFFQDMGADGLSTDNGGIDVMYERGKAQTIFDGDWKRQKLSKKDYEDKRQKADSDYSRMLTLLAAKVQMEAAGSVR